MPPTKLTTTNDDDDGDTYSFGYAFASNFFFVAAAALYLWLALLDYEYETNIQGIPDDVLNADDDYSWLPWWPYGDDYVFPVHNSEVWVTAYQIIYFMAAYCFVIVGVIDLVHGATGKISGSLLVLAGLAGLGSAALVEKDEYLSGILNAVSVHLFLLEGFQILFFIHVTVSRYNTCLKFLLLFGDTCFIAGSGIDVMLSYFWVLDRLSLELSRIGILAAILWVLSALSYTAVTLIQRCGGTSEGLPTTVADSYTNKSPPTKQTSTPRTIQQDFPDDASRASEFTF